MRVLVAAAAGPAGTLAEQLPYERSTGSLADALASDAEGVVWVGSVDSAVRELRTSSGTSRVEAVVVADAAGSWVVPLCGGERANALAVEVADRLDATAVVTSSGGLSAALVEPGGGFRSSGDIEAVSERAASGSDVPVVVAPAVAAWPLPPLLEERRSTDASSGPRIVVTDRGGPHEAGVARLHPPSLVAGIVPAGARPTAVDAELAALLADEGLAREAIGEIAVAEADADELGVLALGFALRPVPADRMSAEEHGSTAASAAAVVAGRDGAVLARREVGGLQVALARRPRPRGHLAVVGLGPGDADQRTPAAADAVLGADVIIGSGPDLEQVRDLLRDRHEVVERSRGDETARGRHALHEAEAGRNVALVCSGDAGVYALGSLVCELARGADADVEVVPGITGATSAAALLGAPVGHDFAVISLSDHATPWEAIAARVRAAAGADLVTVFYHPRAGGQTDHLVQARRILLEHRKPETPVGVVTDAFRADETVEVTTLGELDPAIVGMATTVIVGSTTSTVVDGRMVTPRHYLP